MSFNGSGTFVINSTGQPVVANTVISATVFNALTADLASGLTNCITKDGQSTPTANIPMGSNKITGLANGTLIGDAANLGQVQSTVAKLISITGTDTVLGTMSPTLTAYAAGQLFYFIASGANTGAVTLNIDGLGAKAITRDGSTALAAGDINSGEIVVVIYDGTRFQMINAANSFGNTTINGTLTVTGNTGLQANVSVTSALSVGGTFAVTGAATLGSTLAVTGKSDLPTVSTASANAAVAVITDLSAAGASITSANVGTAVVTTGTVTNLTATSASVASVNAGVALLTTATVTNLTATGASIASANLGNAVISALTLTGVSVASANVGVANITDLRAVGASVTSANLGTAVVTNGTVTNLTATSASVASVNAAVALLTTATVTTLTASGASIASANIGNLQFTAASIASINAGVAVINNLTATSASIASANVGTAVITTGTVTNLTSTAASVASANVGVALITTGTVTSLTATGASVASANVGTAVVTGLTVTNASVASLNAGTATITTGNLTFSSTAQRITGDMSNATASNRLLFQSSTTNGNTSIGIIPNGTSQYAGIDLCSSSSVTDQSRFTIRVDGANSVTQLNSTKDGTGSFLPLTFLTGGSERVRIDTSGNMGIGLSSLTIPLQIGKGGGGNPATSGTTQTYGIARIGSGGAAALDVGTYAAGQVWMQGVNVTNLATNYDLVLQPNGGNVGIGTASPGSKLQLDFSSASTTLASSPVLTLKNTSFTNNCVTGILAQNSVGGNVCGIDFINVNQVVDGSGASGSVGIWTNRSGTKGYNIFFDNSGNVGIGGTADAYDRLGIKGTLPISGAIANGAAIRATFGSGTTTEGDGFVTVLSTENASFTLPNLYHFHAVQGTKGASSTITNQMGFIANSNLTGATNNYGFYSNIASGSNRWNFYAAGTAQNYFAGSTTVGSTSTDPIAANANGIALVSDGKIRATVTSDAILFVNRKTSDGDLVQFYQDGAAEGTISVSGSTVSYNAFAGSHWSQLQDGSKPDILRGTVMESINELCEWPNESNERLPKSKVSDTAGSKKVYGVFMAWDNDWTETNDMLVTSVGAFICRVNSNVTVQEGDLLESNGDGTARVQADDIIRSSTIGKVTSTVKTHQYADGSYCVPTVLYCG